MDGDGNMRGLFKYFIKLVFINTGIITNPDRLPKPIYSRIAKVRYDN